MKHHVGKRQRHIPRGHALDAFDHVARREARLSRRRSRRRIHHHDRPIALGEHQTHVGALEVLCFEVVAVLIGAEVAGERIDGFEHTVQRAHRDALHIGLFNVLLLDVAHYLAEDANVFERVVLRRTSTDPPTKKEQKSEARRRAHDEILDAAAHRNYRLQGL